MAISFLDLRKVNAEVVSEINDALIKVLDSGWYILGESVENFESEMRESLVGSYGGYVVGCNSGTDALILSLLAAGVGAGDEVVTVSHTAIPTISAIYSVGAKPVYVDIDPDTWVMDTSAVLSVVSDKTKAIIPVHLYGNMVDINVLHAALKQINREDIWIVEDVAQAQGSTLSGKQAGTLGHYGTFSFYPSKNLGTIGDGGAIYCDNHQDSERLRMLRNYGQKSRYSADLRGGINSRLDEIHAAVLSVKLKYLNKWCHQKRLLMNSYREGLSALPITFQHVTRRCEPAWHLCVISVETPGMRDALMLYLNKKGIQALIHYPIPNHLQKAFFDGSISLPVTEGLVERIISLPFNSTVTQDELEQVIEAIKAFFKNGKFNLKG